MLTAFHRIWPAGLVDARIIDQGPEAFACDRRGDRLAEPVEATAIALVEPPVDPDDRHAQAVARRPERDPAVRPWGRLEDGSQGEHVARPDHFGGAARKRQADVPVTLRHAPEMPVDLGAGQGPVLQELAEPQPRLA